MKTRINTELSFEVWLNDQTDFLTDETGSFDDNWIVSAGDLFGQMDSLTAIADLGMSDYSDQIDYYDEAA